MGLLKMWIEFKCVNKECANRNIVVEVNKPIPKGKEEITATCPNCNELMQRVWNFSGGIRTSDGYKG